MARLAALLALPIPENSDGGTRGNIRNLHRRNPFAIPCKRGIFLAPWLGV